MNEENCDMLKKLYELVHEGRDSICLTRNTRGYSWDIKVYGDDEKKSLEKIKKINNTLLEHYYTDVSGE